MRTRTVFFALAVAAAPLTAAAALPSTVAAVDGGLASCIEGRGPVLYRDGGMLIAAECEGDVVIRRGDALAGTWSSESRVTDLMTAPFLAESVASSIVDLFGHAGGELLHHRSTDGGRTWSGPMTVPVETRGDDYGAWTGPAGEVVLTSSYYTGSPLYQSRSEILLRSSSGTWSRHDWESSYPRGVAWTSFGAVVCARRTGSDPSAICARTLDGGRRMSDVRAVPLIDLEWQRGHGSSVFLFGYIGSQMHLVRSLDGGVSWSAPVPAGIGYGVRLDISPAGELWFAGPDGLHRSVDGFSWSPQGTLPPSCDDSRLVGLRVLVGGEVVAVRDQRYRLPAVDRREAREGRGKIYVSRDRGGSWSEALLPTPRNPVADPVLVRTPTGRHVALWSEGSDGQTQVRAAHSDDGGRTWAGQRRIDDAPQFPAMDRGIEAGSYSAFPVTPMPAIAAVASADGSVTALWLAREEGACMDVRMSRSGDGITWGASRSLGEATEIAGSPLTLAEDGAGRQVAVWRDGDRLVAARSLDRVTWSPPFDVVAWDGSACAARVSSNLVRAADGSLVLMTDAVCYPDNYVLLHTTSAGFAWDQTPVQLDTWASHHEARLAVRGEGLFLSLLHRSCGRGGCGRDEYSFVTDSVVAPVWTETDVISLDDLLGGNTRGDVFHLDLGERRLRATHDDGDVSDLGALPATGDLLPGVTDLYSRHPSLLYGDTLGDEPKVEFLRYAEQRFDDVTPDHPFFDHIAALVDAGLSGGCSASPPLYCPARAVSRAEMAVFLSRALSLPPDPAPQRFIDVARSHAYFAAIQSFAAAGLTDGCGGGRFCPDRPVTRGQMAVFLVRALALPPGDPTPRFGDVGPGDPFFAEIQALAASGITAGCSASPALYCPDAAVTRGQMAVFLVRGLFPGAVRELAASLAPEGAPWN